MPIAELCTAQVIIAERDETVLAAAKLMRQHNVGTVVVIEKHGSRRKPIGIVTDRDLVMEIIAEEVDPSFIRVGDIMAPELASIDDNCGIFEAIRYMRHQAVRRLPVVDESGSLIGIVSVDDLLAVLADELSALGQLVRNEQRDDL